MAVASVYEQIVKYKNFCYGDGQHKLEAIRKKKVTNKPKSAIIVLRLQLFFVVLEYFLMTTTTGLVGKNIAP